MDINFELYKVFYFVAKNLSFSGASQELFISQSAVSQAINNLEKKMQCQLLVRNTKLVKLTQEGEILFRHVEQAFNFIKTGERSVSQVHSMKQGEVRIGASDTICKHFLMPFFNQYSNLYPEVKIKVTNRTSPKCIELLKKGSVDLAVVNLPEQREKNLQVKNVKPLQYVFIAGKGFDHLRNKTLSLRDLTRYPLIMLEKQSTTRNFIDEFLAKQGVNITPEIELGSVDLLVEMAKIGLGISFVAKDYIERELAEKDIFALSIHEKIPQRNLGIVTNADLPLPVSAQRFVDLLGT